MVKPKCHHRWCIIINLATVVSNSSHKDSQCAELRAPLISGARTKHPTTPTQLGPTCHRAKPMRPWLLSTIKRFYKRFLERFLKSPRPTDFSAATRNRKLQSAQLQRLEFTSGARKYHDLTSRSPRNCREDRARRTRDRNGFTAEDIRRRHHGRG
jgi:hypothetical protein